jgi:histidine ammonia-lyase
MTVLVNGRALTREQVIRVARTGEPVELDPGARDRMRETRAVVEHALKRGESVYGLNTGVGVLKRVSPADDERGPFNDRLVQMHLVGQGPPAPHDVTRACMLRLLNGLARGDTGVRPVIAARLVEAINSGLIPRVRVLGSIGQSDLAPMADLSAELFRSFALAAGEGLALINNNSFATGWAALAISDADNLLASMEAVGALSLEGFGANLTLLHPAVASSRPFVGLAQALGNLRSHLEGSYLWETGGARNLQDPLTFRNLPHIQGAARDTWEFADRELAVELNAAQGNPIVVPEEDRLVSVANYEILPVAIAVDALRVALAPALTSAAERVVKLVDTFWSGLPTGLVDAGTRPPEAGLSFLGITVQALASEARSLAHPVSFEMASSAHAEGIEDRTTMAPLGVRRLEEMVAFGQRIVGLEAVVAAQAVELRGRSPLGNGTAKVLRVIREHVAFTAAGELPPSDLEWAKGVVASGELVSRGSPIH